MAGTIKGGEQAADTIKALYGQDFYQRVGALGGAVRSKAKGFGAGEAGRERARIFGAIGGKVGRRGYVLSPERRKEIKLQVLKQQVRKAESQAIRKQLKAQAEELSRMQTQSLSAKYGKRITW